MDGEISVCAHCGEGIVLMQSPAGWVHHRRWREMRENPRGRNGTAIRRAAIWCQDKEHTAADKRIRFNCYDGASWVGMRWGTLETYRFGEHSWKEQGWRRPWIRPQN